MRKISLIFIIFILMINSLIVNIEATEVQKDENVTQTEVVESIQTTIDTKGKIISAGEKKEIETGSIKDIVQEVTIKITEGEYKGEEYTTNYVLSYDIDGKIVAHELKEGDKVIVQLVEDENGNVTATIQEIERYGYIVILFVLFLLSIILVGGKQGIKAILGLLVTILAIFFILIRGVYNGGNAIFLSIFTSMIIIVLTFFIIGGISKKIITAAIGTLGGVISSGIIATIFNYLAKMSGACEDAIQLSINMQTVNFDFRDLLFAGIIIASLGACMDVGMSIASSLDEIKNKTKTIEWKELFTSGMNIGRDVIGTMTNTLILAYVGGSITLILLFLACNMNLQEILNKEVIAQEIISAIAGSMGVVFTVPITSIVYSILNRDKTVYKTVSENKINGKRSLKL